VGVPEQLLYEFQIAGLLVDNCCGGMPPRRRAAYQKHGLSGYWQEDEQFRERSKLKVDTFYQAMYFVHMGEKDKALGQLTLAYQQHCDGLQFLKVDPDHDGLREEPRFKELMLRLRLE
jgi:hypothetical protein